MAHHSRDSRQRTVGGATMTTGKGIAAARARIETAFRALHSDCRDREQVQADLQLRTSLAEVPNANEQPDEQPTKPETEEEAADTPQVESSFHLKSKALTSAALRSPHVSKHAPRRGNVTGGWAIDVPTEDLNTLIAQALKQLEGK
jgi:FtsZ-interacting cell division protein ZipA